MMLLDLTYKIPYYQMKKILLIVTITLLFYSCESNKTVKTKAQIEQEISDSLKIQNQVDDYMEKLDLSIKWDTAGFSKSGLIITNAKFFTEEYSSYKSVRLTYKNVSGKRIKAIRFKWYGVNAFGEPADCGSINDDGFGGGFDDSGLGSGKTTYGVWGILSRDGDEIIKAWATEIVFEDGTKWKSKHGALPK